MHTLLSSSQFCLFKTNIEAKGPCMTARLLVSNISQRYYLRLLVWPTRRELHLSQLLMQPEALPHWRK